MTEPTITDRQPTRLTLALKTDQWCSCGLSSNHPFRNGSHQISRLCMTPPIDDAILLTQIAVRNQPALSSLYDRYARIIYAIAFRSLQSAEDSEEVMLEVFAQVWRIADRYDQTKGRADTWLFMLARSRILDRLRKLQRQTLAIGRVLDIDTVQVSSSSVEPLDTAVISERREQVIAILSHIPSEQRLVLELAYYQGLSHSEIARKTGISLGTVKTRIRLGLTKLRSQLATIERSSSEGIFGW
jgi:RNA polymerase sigma-70 factor, ECF subfamily